MGLIVICGATADLRKAALLGSNYTKAIFNTRDYEYRKLNASNVGLIDLLYLQESKLHIFDGSFFGTSFYSPHFEAKNDRLLQ